MEYHGTYSKTIFVKDKDAPGGGTIQLEQVKGPLPEGRFLWGGEDYLAGLEAGHGQAWCRSIWSGSTSGTPVR